MIGIENANDFEFYSANSAGGIQGYGYECRNNGSVIEGMWFEQAAYFVSSPRLIRMITSTNWSVHDLILVDCECNGLLSNCLPIH